MRDRRPSTFLLASCASIAMLSLSLGTIGPLLPRFSAAMHSGVYTGLVIAAHPIGSLLAAVPAVFAARRLGLARTIGAGALVGFAASVLFVWPGAGWWIVLARVGYGFCATTVWQSVFAWSITNTAPGRRARTIGTLMAASTAGGLAAPQLGALAAHAGVWLCALPPVLLLLVSTRFRRLPACELLERPDLGRLRRALRSQDAFGGGALTVAGALVTLGLTVSIPLALHERGVGAFGIGVALTLGAAALIGLNPLAGRVLDHGRTRPLLVGAFTLLTVAIAGLALAPSALLAVPLAVAAWSLTGMPNLAGAALTSRAVANAGVDQTVSQALTTVVWGPAAISGSLAAGAAGSPQTALLVLATATALIASGLAVELAQHRQTPLPV